MESIYKKVKQFVDTAIRLLKLKAIDKVTTVISLVIANFSSAILILIVLMITNIAVALYTGYLLNSTWEGFACLTALYALLSIAGGFFKNNLQKLLNERIIRHFQEIINR